MLPERPESAARSDTFCRMPLTLWVHATALLCCTFLQQGHAQCYTENAVCSGASTALTTAEECCLGDGQSYNEDSSYEICYVIRYRPTSLTLNEGDQSTLTVEVFKPPAETGSGNVAFTIMNEDNIADVRVGGADSPTGNLLFNFFGRERGFTIRAEADQIGQEGTETITIPLVVTSASPTVFVGPPATVTVIDQSVVLVEITETGYQQAEGQGNNVITAQVLYNREIANPIMVTFFPVTYDRYLNALDLQLPTSFPGREVEADDGDFDGTPITITLPNPAGGTVCQVELQIPVIDDMINEHQETLVGFIQIDNAIDEGTIQLGRTATQLIINDNDDITIGFTEESYTFTEGQSEAFVTLAKDAGRISQRTDIAAMVSLGPNPSATPISDFSITLLDSRINFEESDQSINIPLSILEDNLPEGVESFTLSVVSADFPFDATRTDTFPTAQVVITHNDDVVVGLEQTIYTVAESAGSVEVCAVVINPPPSQPLSSSFTLIADTLAASAVGGSDYTDVNNLLPVFNNNNRRRCFTIDILEDNVPEDNEMFETLLTVVSGSDVIVDPAEATVTIIDVDIQTGFRTHGDGCIPEGMLQEICLTTVGSPAVDTVLTVSVTHGTAGPEDFDLITTQVTITENMTEPCVSYQAIADGLGLEGVENLTLSLSGPPNVQLTTASLHICIQDSDGDKNPPVIIIIVTVVIAVLAVLLIAATIIITILIGIMRQRKKKQSKLALPTPEPIYYGPYYSSVLVKTENIASAEISLQTQPETSTNLAIPNQQQESVTSPIEQQGNVAYGAPSNQQQENVTSPIEQQENVAYGAPSNQQQESVTSPIEQQENVACGAPSNQQQESVTSPIEQQENVAYDALSNQQQQLPGEQAEEQC